MKQWPKMGGVITFAVSGELHVGIVTGKNRNARRPVFHVDGIYTLRVQDEHITWMHGAFADTEAKRAFLAAEKLAGSAP